MVKENHAIQCTAVMRAALLWSSQQCTKTIANCPAHQKQVRKSRTSVEVQAIYYVMEGVIYQTPTVQKLIKSRLNKFTHHLNNAFGETPSVSGGMGKAIGRLCQGAMTIQRAVCRRLSDQSPWLLSRGSFAVCEESDCQRESSYPYPSFRVALYALAMR